MSYDTTPTDGGYDIELLARSLFDSRSLSGKPISDESWARHGEMFKATHRRLLAEATELVQSGELDGG